MKRYLIETIEELKKDLNKYITDYEIQIQALENVEIVTQEDGKPFKDLDRNFVNAEVIIDPGYEWISLFVHYTDPHSGFTTIDLYKNVGAEEYKEILENKDKYKGKLIDRGIYVNPIYQYGVEEIPQLIQARIDKIKEMLAEYKKSLKRIEENEEEMIKKIVEFEDYLEETVGSASLCDYLRYRKG